MIGPDVLDGGEGSDYVNSYIQRAAPVRVDLRVTTGQGQAGENDILENIENVIAGNGDDVLIGNDAANDIWGELGQDVIQTGAGNDHIHSTTQSNRLSPHYGPDRVDAGAGNDLIETAPTMESRIACGAGKDRIKFEGFAPENDRPHSSPGPLVSRHCERMSMDGFPKSDVSPDDRPADGHRHRAPPHARGSELALGWLGLLHLQRVPTAADHEE